MDRRLLSQITGKILRCADKQDGLTPVEFSRAVLNAHGWRHLRKHIPQSDEIAEAPAAVAEIWQGGWVVPCPFCKTGLEDGDPTSPLFLCCSCWNAEAGGKLLRVEYPKRRERIERLLLLRPEGKTRNWLRHEVVADLERENREHGLGVS